jgi:RNA polymerase-binding protein DksA
MQTRHLESKRNMTGDLVPSAYEISGRLGRKTTEGFRRGLFEQKRSLLRRRREALAAEEQLLAEREPDWDDLAATQTAAALLEGLRETERTEIARIQAALDRIAQGTYGRCSVCGRPIDKKRLRAQPDASQCGHCAGAGQGAIS